MAIMFPTFAPAERQRRQPTFAGELSLPAPKAPSGGGLSPLSGLSNLQSGFKTGFGDDLDPAEMTPAQRIGAVLAGQSLEPRPAPASGLFGVGDFNDSASGWDWSPDGALPLRLDFDWT